MPLTYTLETEINAPRDDVVALFLNPDNLYAWQPSLVTFEALDGDGVRGVGTRSRQLHRMGKREVEMLSTITRDDPPEAFSATYEADDVWNLIENRFLEAGPGKTRWLLTSEFRCSSFFMRAMTTLAPGLFKKQTRQFMGYFKDFVEGRGGSFDR